ncbi:MAG TPA: GntR family transcriptional regulator [Vicinamibacterales bacterium]|nr:GntR family transcriptional regulator [Vicinamibacterales bacterium]
MGGLLTVDHRHPTPLYAQLEQAIRGAIGAGRLPPGAQLPTVRQLAVELKVNANTVARVYADLERAGVLETRRGVGTFVAAAQPALGSKRGRENELKAIVRRAIDEAASRGFSIRDVLGVVEAYDEKTKSS